MYIFIVLLSFIVLSRQSQRLFILVRGDPNITVMRGCDFTSVETIRNSHAKEAMQTVLR